MQLKKNSLSILTAITLGLNCQAAFAGSVAIPIHSLQAPAADLLDENKNPIDRDEAAELESKGIDLSVYDPSESDAWQSKAYADNLAFPEEKAQVEFTENTSFIKGSTRIRVSVDLPNLGTQHYYLVIGLSNPFVIAEAATLRKTGFRVPLPKYYNNLTVNFPSVEKRERFLDSISDTTQTARTRWTVDYKEKEQTVTLQGAILEPIQGDLFNFQWGALSPNRIKGHRALRSLIVPYSLFYLTEGINLYSWEAGKVMSDNVVLSAKTPEMHRYLK